MNTPAKARKMYSNICFMYFPKVVYILKYIHIYDKNVTK